MVPANQLSAQYPPNNRPTSGPTCARTSASVQNWYPPTSARYMAVSGLDQNSKTSSQCYLLEIQSYIVSLFKLLITKFTKWTYRSRKTGAASEQKKIFKMDMAVDMGPGRLVQLRSSSSSSTRKSPSQNWRTMIHPQAIKSNYKTNRQVHLPSESSPSLNDMETLQNPCAYWCL